MIQTQWLYDLATAVNNSLEEKIISQYISKLVAIWTGLYADSQKTSYMRQKKPYTLISKNKAHHVLFKHWGHPFSRLSCLMFN